jgi:hypothetical protein
VVPSGASFISADYMTKVYDGLTHMRAPGGCCLLTRSLSPASWRHSSHDARKVLSNKRVEPNWQVGFKLLLLSNLQMSVSQSKSGGQAKVSVGRHYSNAVLGGRTH